MQRLGLGNDLPQRAFKYDRVERTPKLDILADIVRGARGVDLMRKPDAALRIR